MMISKPAQFSKSLINQFLYPMFLTYSESDAFFSVTP